MMRLKNGHCICKSALWCDANVQIDMEECKLEQLMRRNEETLIRALDDDVVWYSC